MKLEKIVTLANEPVRLRFLAMERSLRAVGCDLPLLVIPYDNRKFDLPPNASWWTTDIRDWLIGEKAHPMMFKYQCLTTANYQFIDSDAVFLRDPAKVLENETGFITSCGHWNDPGETLTPESLQVLQEKTIFWQLHIFNAGQFACDQALFTEEELKQTCLNPRYEQTCLRNPYNDQPGMVLLANLSRVPIRNLTLPPKLMESTWAEAYDNVASYEAYWRDADRKPYLIHWAGCDMWIPREIDKLFTQYLSASELADWKAEVAARHAREMRDRSTLRFRVRRFLHGYRAYKLAVEDYP